MYEKFKALLIENRITTYLVSKDTGIAASTFSDWKRGRSKPKLDKLQILADYFNVPITYFLEDKKNKAQQAGLRKEKVCQE